MSRLFKNSQYKSGFWQSMDTYLEYVHIVKWGSWLRLLTQAFDGDFLLCQNPIYYVHMLKSSFWQSIYVYLEYVHIVKWGFWLRLLTEALDWDFDWGLWLRFWGFLLCQHPIYYVHILKSSF